MTSVFGYPGGKTRAISILDAQLEKHFPTVQTIYSPFLGGASFELHCAYNHGLKIYGNDLFRPLIQFWKALKSSREDLEDTINEMTPISKTEYYSCLPFLEDPKLRRQLQPITLGALFYVLIQSSFSNSLGHWSSKVNGRVSVNDTKFDRAGGAKTLKRFQFSHTDAIEFIKKHKEAGATPQSILFLDPPYDLKRDRSLYGVNGRMHKGFDHEALRDVLVSRPYWMLCYNDTKHIRQLYKDKKRFKIKSLKWKYTLQSHRGQEHTDSNEILIISSGFGIC